MNCSWFVLCTLYFVVYLVLYRLCILYYVVSCVYQIELYLVFCPCMFCVQYMCYV